MQHLSFLTTLFVTCYSVVCAQTKSQHQTYVEIGGLVSSNGRTPFWLRANQFGIIPYSSPAGTLRIGMNGAVLLTDTAGLYARKAPSRAWVLSYAAEVVGNAGKENRLLAPEYYVKLAHRQIEFVVGRRREVIGLVDTMLTSGSYSWSGNALPIPKVQFGTKGFTSISRRKWLAINAFIAHGWFANTDYMQHSFLHQKSVFFRVGKPKAALRFYVGLNHNVQWAGRSDSLDYHYAINGQLPGQLRDFPNVLFNIRTEGLNNPRITSFDYDNLYGNHVGSLDFGFDVRLPWITLLFYHQHSYDDSSGIVFFQNVPDGLSGLRIQPTRRGLSNFYVDDFLLEFLSTMSQSGPVFDPYVRVFGADNYFNNRQYLEGWTYKKRIIGTPFITLRQDVKPEYRTNTNWTVGNNRVQVAHVGIRATVARQIKLLAKISYSKNYGVPMAELLPAPPAQWSSLVQLGMPLPWLGGTSLTVLAAADSGELYTNATGAYIGLRKTVRGQLGRRSD